MDFDLRNLSSRDRYRLLAGLVVPRPIALVTTVDPQGRVNAAPFSFFNVLGSEPALVVLGIGDRAGGEPKDTALNIRATGQFVVNLVNEAIAHQMNICSVDFPAGTDELLHAGFTCAPSLEVRPPRIVESPVNLECREISTTEFGRNRVIMGEVLRLHVHDGIVGPDNLHVDAGRLQLIGRMHGGGWYTKTTDLFEMPRVSFQDFKTQSAQASPG